MTARIPSLLFLAATLFVPGCSCGNRADKAMKTRPPKRVAGGPVAAPEGARWKAASVEIEIAGEKRLSSGSKLPIESTTWTVRPVLVLSGDSGEVRVVLAAEVRGSGDEARFVRAADAGWRLHWAPDGRGVACAPEGDEMWHWVFCDTPRPYYPSNVRFLLGTGTVSPDFHGPKFREHALEMMKTPPGPDTALSFYPRPLPEEWPGLAASVACEDTDGELLEPLAAAALREGSGLVLSALDRTDQSLVQQAVVRIASDSRSSVVERGQRVRKLAIEALRVKQSAGSVVASNAAVLAARLPDAEIEEALSGALLSEDWAPASTVARDAEWPRAVAWSLARSVEARGSAPEGVEKAMLAFLERATDKPESALPILFALATHGSGYAREALVGIGKSGEGGATPPAWPASLDELWKAGVEDHGARVHSLDAWARAAANRTK